MAIELWVKKSRLMSDDQTASQEDIPVRTRQKKKSGNQSNLLFLTGYSVDLTFHILFLTIKNTVTYIILYPETFLLFSTSKRIIHTADRKKKKMNLAFSLF